MLGTLAEEVEEQEARLSLKLPRFSVVGLDVPPVRSSTRAQFSESHVGAEQVADETECPSNGLCGIPRVDIERLVIPAHEHVEIAFAGLDRHLESVRVRWGEAERNDGTLVGPLVA